MAHVFISYQHDDVDFAENVKHRVEKAGFEVWMDSDKLSAGEDWREGIDQGIKTASALIVVMTPGAKASEYVTYEWAFAWGAGVPVIPIMLKPTPLHPRLEALQYLDFTNRARPWDRLLARLGQVGASSSHGKGAARHKLPNYLQQAVDDLDDADTTKRSEAIDTLGQINLPEAREALATALEHPLRDMPFKVALKLAELKDQRSVPVLMQNLKSNKSETIESAAMALARIGNPTVIPALVEAIPRVKGVMQMLVINSLSKIEDPSTIPALITILQSETASTRSFASDALRNIGSPAVPPLIDALNSNDSTLRALSAWTLGLIENPAAVAALIAHLNDRGVSSYVFNGGLRSVRSVAATALERIGTPEALAAVEEWREQQGSTQPEGEKQ